MPFDIQVTRTKEPKPRPPAGDLGFGRFYSDHQFLAENEGRNCQHEQHLDRLCDEVEC